MRYGFDDAGLDRIIAQTLAVNAGSRAVMERSGLTYVTDLSNSMTDVEGVEAGEVEYELTREQWERRTTSSLNAPTEIQTHTAAWCSHRLSRSAVSDA